MESLVNFLDELLDESRGILHPFFVRGDLEVETKEDASPVTLADRETERVLREKIHSRFPDHGIIGEEFGSEKEDAEHVWVLDPIDGTKSFISGVPLFGTLICLLQDGQPILGAIDQPILDQRMVGDGKVTSLNGQPVRVRDTSDLCQATLLTSDPMDPAIHQSENQWDTLTRKVNIYRTWGDCYGYLLLASGKADIMVDPIVSKWDFLPVIPIIQGAGGIITDWQGKDPVEGNSIVAATPGLHAQAIRILNSGNITSTNLRNTVELS